MKAGRRPPRFPPAGPTEGSPVETVAFVILVAVLLSGAAVWVAGELSGRIFGGAWPSVGADEVASILVRFPDNLADPAEAWPPHARRLVPGPAALYGALAFVLAPPLGIGVWLLRQRVRDAMRTGATARWANPRDLRLLWIREPTPGRLTLGRVDGHLVAAEARQSVIVVGPVQTGKTMGFAVPAILEWAGPVVATSVKTDLLRDTFGARSAIKGSDVWVYDPTAGTGFESAGWTPVAACETWQGAQRVASWLVSATHHASSGLDSAEFWYSAAAKLLAPILFAAAQAEGTMTEVVRWIDTQEEDDVKYVLEASGEPAALTAFEASTLRDPKTRSGVYTTAETVLAAYADPGVLSSAVPDIRPERLLDGGRHTLYLCAPAHEQRRLQPLFTTLVQEMVAAAYERATEKKGHLDPPLLLVLDECANIAPLRDLATLASTGAGQGIQLVSVFQDLTQVIAVYGRDRAPTIVSNHRAKVILSGIADASTFDYVDRLLGDEEVQQVSSTKGAEGRRSTTESVAYRSIAPANALREMRPGRGLLIYGHLSPARLDLRPWFKDPRLRALVGRQAEASASSATTGE
jgi:type IV secretion system protein VirD4